MLVKNNPTGYNGGGEERIMTGTETRAPWILRILPIFRKIDGESIRREPFERSVSVHLKSLETVSLYLSIFTEDLTYEHG